MKQPLRPNQLTSNDKKGDSHNDRRFYLAHYDNVLAGVGSLKKLTEGIAEIQRMYVLPVFRGKGIGRADNIIKMSLM